MKKMSLSIILLLTSCSVALTEKAKLVTELEKGAPLNNCKLLGNATSHYKGITENNGREQALNLIRNRAIDLHGNRFKVTAYSYEDGTANYSADIYQCE